MLESLNPFQQLLLGVSTVGVIMIILVVFLTASPNFENNFKIHEYFFFCLFFFLNVIINIFLN